MRPPSVSRERLSTLPEVAVRVEIVPIQGIPEVGPGDDLGAILRRALADRDLQLQDGDLVVVTQKVVSKAEGRVVPEGPGGKAGWVAKETRRVVARRGDLVIAETRHGFVCANAGVDASNVPAGYLALLPEDPDGSAERLREALCAWSGAEVGVVITDTFGRPWRQGLVNVAIGCAGLPALMDLRGTKDATGRVLEATVEAFADEVAAASGLVMGKADGVPVAIVRGLHAEGLPLPASALLRPAGDDLFRESILEAVLGFSEATSFGPGEVPQDVVQEALLAAGSAVRTDDGHPWILVEVLPGRPRARLADAADAEAARILASAPLIVAGFSGPASGATGDQIPGDGERDALLLCGGAALQNLRLALRAVGLSSRWIPPSRFGPEEAKRALGVAEQGTLLGAVAAGWPPTSA
jgi:dehydro coenzyme F420 reductase / coenzyme F420-0:L-glutamate ligase / coenzyme F420-1:gamma-L-glutamate ligase